MERVVCLFLSSVENGNACDPLNSKLSSNEDGKVADTLEGADPSSLANKVAVNPQEPAPELTKENESSQEQIQGQDGLDDALKRRLNS
ncbi:hypothetical protein L3X38_001247 [Prunus dulcis]|uniref:Uncharacterized protein n=1 Tax=Prunus dulcis TaxID=3755 RepID=A0AAD4WRQ1_PRUDU|nr:hypothetical protein L3X38_001247 [Prunus dulcis]